MTTAEWLSRGKYAQAEIKELKEIYQKETGQIERGFPSPTSSKSVEEYISKLNVAISMKYKIFNEIIDVIQSLPDMRYRYILFGFYINRQTIEQVAEGLHISEMWVKELHKKALKEVAKILEEQNR